MKRTTSVDVASWLPARAPDAHKGQCGHVLVLSGHAAQLGAGFLASLAALRAGAGLATFAAPHASLTHLDARFPEIMCERIADDGRGYFTASSVAPVLPLALRKQAVVLGPAIGTHPETIAFVNALVPQLQVPLVLDADGLNSIAAHPDILLQRAAPTVITPHPLEMARLVGSTAETVQADRIGTAQRFAREYRCIVVLKGAGTAIADPSGSCWVNPTGNPGMATAGMGDALSGVIAALIAQGMNALHAALSGCYLHGLAGDLAARAQHGEAGMIASDLIAHLPQARAQVEREGAR